MLPMIVAISQKEVTCDTTIPAVDGNKNSDFVSGKEEE
jgi:hypothetical protein